MDALRLPLRRVLWAVDPYERDAVLDPSAYEEFSQWSTERHIEIEPAYIYTPGIQTESIERETRKFVKEIASQSRIRNVAAPKIILELVDSITTRVAALMTYASESNAGLIGIASHGRTGLSRLMFGSFAETLLTHSPLPVFFLKHYARPGRAKSKKVLWATDFSKTCESAFDVFLSQAKGLYDHVIVFHDISLALEFSRFAGPWNGTELDPNGIVEDNRRWARSEAGRWMEKIEKNGYKADSVIETGRSIPIDILAAANQAAVGAIAMSSSTGPFSSLLLGSNARSVFRTGEFPVWVYGPAFCDLHATAAAEVTARLNP